MRFSCLRDGRFHSFAACGACWGGAPAQLGKWVTVKVRRPKQSFPEQGVTIARFAQHSDRIIAVTVAFGPDDVREAIMRVVVENRNTLDMVDVFLRRCQSASVHLAGVPVLHLEEQAQAAPLLMSISCSVSVSAASPPQKGSETVPTGREDKGLVFTPTPMAHTASATARQSGRSYHLLRIGCLSWPCFVVLVGV